MNVGLHHFQKSGSWREPSGELEINVLYLDLHGDYSGIYLYKNLRCTLKIYAFYFCKLYLNKKKKKVLFSFLKVFTPNANWSSWCNWLQGLVLGALC